MGVECIAADAAAAVRIGMNAMPVRSSRTPRVSLAFAAISTVTAALAPFSADARTVDVARTRDATAPADHAMQEFIVKYRHGRHARPDADSLRRALLQAEADFSQAAGLRRVSRSSDGSDVIRAERPLNRTDAFALMQCIARDPRIEYVVPNAEARAAMRANDGSAADPWVLDAAGGTDSSGGGIAPEVRSDAGLAGHEARGGESETRDSTGVANEQTTNQRATKEQATQRARGDAWIFTLREKRRDDGGRPERRRIKL